VITPEEKHEMVLFLHRKGTPLLDIAKDTGYSPATVNAIIRGWAELKAKSRQRSSRKVRKHEPVDWEKVGILYEWRKSDVQK